MRQMRHETYMLLHTVDLIESEFRTTDLNDPQALENILIDIRHAEALLCSMKEEVQECQYILTHDEEATA